MLGTLGDSFAGAVSRPERTAIIYGDRTWSYAQLNARSNQLALLLRLGVMKGELGELDVCAGTCVIHAGERHDSHPAYSRHSLIQLKEEPAMASSDASPLIGTWKQLSGTMVEEGSTSERSNLSDAPNGFVNFSADGRLILLSTDSARKKPAGEVPTAAEAEALYRSMIAYAGTYKLAGNKVTYHLEATWNESWTGSTQVRFWKVEGDLLTITTPEIVNPLTGKRSVFKLTFRKIGGRGA